MKLDKTLNFKKVRCVKGYDDCLEIGKEYEVIDISVEIKVKDDEGNFLYWESDYFEPVLDSVVNPLQNMKLTPEFETEVSEPKFKVGDKVYIPGDHRVLPILFKNGEWFGVSYKEVNPKYILHATQENYEKLCSLFERIDFERPPLTGNELCRKLLNKGEKYIMAKDDTDTWRIICDYCDDWFTDVVSGKCLKNVTPINSKGEQLTEAALDE